MAHSLHEIELLDGIALFESIPDEVLKDFVQANRFRFYHYRPNNFVVFANDHCKEVHIVLEGLLTAEYYQEGGQLYSLATFKRGGLFGAHATYSEKSIYPVTVTAKTKATLLSIDGELFFNLISTRPAMLKEFLRLMSANTVVLNTRVIAQMGSTLRVRLLSFLLRQSNEIPGTYSAFGMTKTRLSELLGVQRTSLSRELAAMRSEGLIRFDRHRFLVEKAGKDFLDSL
ncbi:MAG: Crp/Fnr family transcriptional regulator [Sphaerochaetaceae bacterium]|jgi:CRP-like cAMP-binding protein|nr:Crp/Fnr family transcriptional regulator [Sphaerochaetaceae bacterium]